MMDESYVAGFCDGDGSICIGKCRDGFQFKVEFTQCSSAFLKKMNATLGSVGKMYEDARHDKYTKETATQLRLCGLATIPLLHVMSCHAIIKAPQACLGMRYLELARQPGLYEVREEMWHQMKAMNKDKSSYDKDYSRINAAYIAGLFDAEGNVYLSANGKKYYVKITQKCDAMLIKRIQAFLGFGHISASEPYRLRFHNKNDIHLFWEYTRPYLNTKKGALQALVVHLGTN